MSSKDANKTSYVEVNVNVCTKVLLLEVNEPETKAENTEEEGHYCQIVEELIVRDLVFGHITLLILILLLLFILTFFFFHNLFSVKYDFIFPKVFDTVCIGNYLETVSELLEHPFSIQVFWGFWKIDHGVHSHACNENQVAPLNIDNTSAKNLVVKSCKYDGYALHELVQG